MLFLTSNQAKFKEYYHYLPGLKMKVADLPEIQSLDHMEVITHKLAAAKKLFPKQEFFIEDQALVFKKLNGLPGTLVKFFLHALGNKGIYKFAKAFQARRAENWISLACRVKGEDVFIRTKINGTIVAPKGNLDFGWGPIFQPDGSKKTYGQMKPEEKAKFSPRLKAIRKLRRIIEK